MTRRSPSRRRTIYRGGRRGPWPPRGGEGSLLLEVAFQVGFQHLDAVTPQVVEPGGIAAGLPFEGELETDREVLLHLLFRLLLPLEPGDLGLDQSVLLDRVVAHDG